MDEHFGRLPAEANDAIASLPEGAGVDAGRESAAVRLNGALEALLSADFSGAMIELNPEGFVHRTRYAERLGVSHTYLCKVCGETLANWDSRLQKLNGGLNPTAREFIDLVRRDSRTDSGVIARGSRLNLSRYALKMGKSPATIRFAMGNLLTQFEAELRDERVLRPIVVKSLTPKQCQSERLRKYIEDDNAAAVLRLSESGKILRSYYAGCIGTHHFTAESREVLAFWDVTCPPLVPRS